MFRVWGCGVQGGWALRCSVRACKLWCFRVWVRGAFGQLVPYSHVRFGK